jgi:hypothetical protein
MVLTITDAASDLPLAYQEIQDALAQAEAAIYGDSFVVPALQCVAAMWATYLGDHDTARNYAQTSMATARRVANPTLLSVAHYTLSSVTEHDDPVAALAHYDEAIALVRAGASNPIYVTALSRSAIHLARTGNHAEALDRLRETIERAHYEADVTALVGTVASTLIVLDTLDSVDTTPELAGFVTLGKYAHLTFGPIAAHYGLTQTVERLRTHIGQDLFDEAAARGAAMNADEIAAFTHASIDRARLTLPTT